MMSLDKQNHNQKTQEAADAKTVYPRERCRANYFFKERFCSSIGKYKILGQRQGSFAFLIVFWLRSFLESRGKLFNSVLPVAVMIETLTAENKIFRNRLFSPVVTLRYFLFQVLSADHSCREVVGQKVAETVKAGRGLCSSNTASYCAARKKLPLEWVMKMVRWSGKELHDRSIRLWRGRSVKLIDGTTVSMPDTPANQKEYPQLKGQKAGIGFPIARLVAIISLSCGSVLDIAIGPYEGKGTGEHSLLRRIIGNFKKTT